MLAEDDKLLCVAVGAPEFLAATQRALDAMTAEFAAQNFRAAVPALAMRRLRV